MGRAVGASLADELLTTRLSARRAAVGMLALVAASVNPHRRRFKAPSADVMFVVNNPVAHGAALAEAVERGLTDEGLRCAVVADPRLMDFRADLVAGFPALGVRSLVGWTSPILLWRAWLTARAAMNHVPAPRHARGAVLRYLLLAQSVRFLLAQEVVDQAHGRWPRTVTDFDHGVYAAPFVFSLRSAGISLATLVHGSPTSTYLPALASHVLVWGEVQKEFFRQSPDSKALVVGRPDWEAEELDDGPIGRLVLCHSMETLSVTEQRRVRDVIRAAGEHGIQVMVRWHPRLSEDRPADWTSAIGTEVVDASSGSLRSVLRPGDIAVVVASTAGVEALIGGRRVVVLADDDRELPCDLAAIKAAHFELGDMDDEHRSAEGAEMLGRLQRRILGYGSGAASRRLAEELLRLPSEVLPDDPA